MALVFISDALLEDAEFSERVYEVYERTQELGTDYRDSQALRQLWQELSVRYLTNDIDVDGLRDVLQQHRGRLNLELTTYTVLARSEWFDRLKLWFAVFSLSALLMLFGPIWVFRQTPPGEERQRKTLRSIPYFFVAAIVTVFVSNILASLVIDVQKLQVTLASFGAPPVAATDALLHYLIHSSDEELLALLDLLFQARHQIGGDPVGAVGLLNHLWVGVQIAHESEIFDAVGTIVTTFAWILDLYAPILAVAASVWVYWVVSPVVKNLVTYPVRASKGQEVESLWQLTKQQLAVIFWRELKASAWAFLFLIVLVLVVVVIMRLVTAALVVVSIKTLLAVESLLAAGDLSFEIPLVVAMVSLALFLGLAMLSCLVPCGVILTRSYQVIRTRLIEKRGFRSFPQFWRTVGGMLFGVVGLGFLSAAVVAAVYWGMLTVVADPMARIWLTAPIFGPGMCLVLWRLRVLERFVTLVRLDPRSDGKREKNER